MAWFWSICETALMLSLSFIFTCIIGLLLVRLLGGHVHLFIVDDEADEGLKELLDEERDE